MDALRESGASAVEYSLLVVLVAAVIISVVGALGQDVLGLVSAVCGGASPFNC